MPAQALESEELQGQLQAVHARVCPQWLVLRTLSPPTSYFLRLAYQIAPVSHRQRHLCPEPKPLTTILWVRLATALKTLSRTDGLLAGAKRNNNRSIRKSLVSLKATEPSIKRRMLRGWLVRAFLQQVTRAESPQRCNIRRTSKSSKTWSIKEGDSTFKMSE